MLTHDKIWNTIDLIAQQVGTTPSGLARKAGLDATTFNKSKRFGQNGRERWPSTETLARILEVAGMDLVAFATLVASLPDAPNHAEGQRGQERTN